MTKSLSAIMDKISIQATVKTNIIERMNWANNTGYKLHRLTVNGIEGGGNLPVSLKCQLWAAILLAQLIKQHKLGGILRVICF